MYELKSSSKATSAQIQMSNKAYEEARKKAIELSAEINLQNKIQKEINVTIQKNTIFE
jgi:hypothetical protein